MFTVHIYLHDCQRWWFGTLPAAQTESEAQRLAEAVALCYGANVHKPHKAVYALSFR